MKHARKITYLRSFAILVVLMLGAIQFYLVSNTYHLIRQNFYEEVTSLVDSFQNEPAVLKIHEAVLSDILTLTAGFAAHKFDKDHYLNYLAEKVKKERASADRAWIRYGILHPQLRDIKYVETYERILFEKDGHTDSLLYGEAEALKLLGSSSDLTKGTWQFTRQPKEALITQDGPDPDPAGNYKISFSTSRYINFASGREIFTRMSFVFILSFALMIAVILLLFLNFKAIYQQKQIADIRSDFASNITHELQTPVSSVALIVKTLKNRAVQTNQRLLDETIDALDRQQKRLSTSVESVLESAMLEKNEFRTEPLLMPGFLVTFINDFPLNGRTFELNLLHEPVTINTGKRALERVLRNILENAVKYSPADKKVTISSGVTAKYYTITIRDEGPGIDKKYHRSIFDKFYRIPQHNLHAVKGLGLGLFLCNELIIRLNGFITLESTAGKGASFTLHLPKT